MKSKVESKGKYPLYFAIFCFIVIGYLESIPHAMAQEVEKEYREIKGLVLRGNTRKVLEYASVSIDKSNISTITNKDGVFVLKVPKSLFDGA